VLYLVATPIGNLGDISARALEILREVDLIAAEDTRHSGNLLRHYQITKPLVSYHEHNEARRTAELLTSLEAGRKVALITDAGLPAISDPGHRLIDACIQRGLPYSVIPGPSAVLTALVGSGFPTERFCFCGFLPVKSGQRERELLEAANRTETTVFFESPHRLIKTLETAARLLPDRLLCVARELTKQFEEYRRGSAPELLAHYAATPARGEIVLLVAGRSVKEARDEAREMAREARKTGRRAALAAESREG
jgi:16S rRNA (cytidine1402-2'-O)-methyltransferase